MTFCHAIILLIYIHIYGYDIYKKTLALIGYKSSNLKYTFPALSQGRICVLWFKNCNWIRNPVPKPGEQWTKPTWKKPTKKEKEECIKECYQSFNTKMPPKYGKGKK